VRWMEHFKEHLNEGSRIGATIGYVGVDIDLPSREEIEEALKHPRNNKAPSADSIAAELLKNGRPKLVDALHAVIQQVWTSETLSRC
jgi:hypothetical protein